MKNAFIYGTIGVLGVAAFVALFLLSLALIFGVGWVIGWLALLVVPSLQTWAISTLGVSFPVLSGTAFMLLRPLFVVTKGMK